MIAATPPPPYTALIFTSIRSSDDDDGYARMSERMLDLAASQPGFLGVESARQDVGITVSYWASEQHARAWKQVAEHLAAQKLGKDRWYADYRVRIATVEREYGTVSDSPAATAGSLAVDPMRPDGVRGRVSDQPQP